MANRQQPPLNLEPPQASRGSGAIRASADEARALLAPVYAGSSRFRDAHLKEAKAPPDQTPRLITNFETVSKIKCCVDQSNDRT